MKKLGSFAALCTGGLMVAGGIETMYFYERTMKRKKIQPERTAHMSGTDWSQYSDFLAERKEYIMSCEQEEVSRISHDGLKLEASFFPPKLQEGGKKRIILCFHGYRQSL